MKHRHPRLITSGLLLAIINAIIPIPVIADTASNFGKISLAPGFSVNNGTVGGYTGGSYSLSAISNRDRDRNACIGFASPKPDHILVLEKDLPRLKIQVDSGGKDTTLLVKGPDEILCGDDTGRNKDASIEQSKWKAGTYSIWVGTFNSGTKLNYTLSIQE
ncbi:hypothetical protein [Iningainema tapete]|uniref:Uncharacterized protein n=1 Tax=Iningainema tapete BLCC-T55 TaxID=2748662 RepID=A0A8J6XX66_9CYAN|nr:hypothetical protein [Iningainema tapete]MBD2777997.1 hypothetical protein [Iningainema tapete BLCC-T55]